MPVIRSSALRLLALYVEHYWAVAAPQNIAHKKRFASQVIKRFEAGVTSFAESAATAQRDALLGNWRSWRSAGRHTTRRSWPRLQTIYLPCFSARFVM